VALADWLVLAKVGVAIALATFLLGHVYYPTLIFIRSRLTAWVGSALIVLASLATGVAILAGFGIVLSLIPSEILRGRFWFDLFPVMLGALIVYAGALYAAFHPYKQRLRELGLFIK
jgi:hypothetical protein